VLHIQQNFRMAPTDASNNDEAFLTLLSAQREFLNQMSMEKTQEREQQQRLHKQSQEQRQQQRRFWFQHELMWHQHAQKQNSRYFEVPSDASGLGKYSFQSCSVNPFSLMNQPVINRRSSMEYLQATRRLSMRMGIGVGKDSFVMPSELDDEWEDLKESDEDDASRGHHEVKSKTQRRRSSLGIVSALIQADPRILSSRRSSLVSTVSKSFLDGGSTHSYQAENMSSQPLVDSTISFETCDPSDLTSQILPQDNNMGKTALSTIKNDRFIITEKREEEFPVMRLDPSIDLPTLTHMIKMFADAMNSSTKSQQDIHDWDRKMGLKRSHSKTMRMSMRSRKKLRAVMNKEMATIKSVMP
jgi:hypothetical protein